MPDDTVVRLQVEVAFATPAQQYLISVELGAGATIADAIAAARLQQPLPDSIDGLEVGTWGRVADRQTVVRDGDRVEIYRPLEMDPREARRLYAAAGETMAQGATAQPDA